MKDNNKEEIRIQAISIVNGFKPVLTNEEFIDYMYKATRLRLRNEVTTDGVASIRDQDGKKNEVELIEDALFGSFRSEVDTRMMKRVKIQHILTDESVPKNFRLFFVNSTPDDNWSDFRNSLGIKL